MPELPDITLYQEALEARIRGRRLITAEISSPFLLRTAEPPVQTAYGRKVIAVRRIGKRIVLSLEGDLWLLFHLMIAGRFHWREARPGRGGRWSRALAAFEFDTGRLLLTEAGTRKRASLYVVQGAATLELHDPGGLEPLELTLGEFMRAVMAENHTLKRALTDPRILSGIGNAYSDEILHRARLSPIQLSERLTAEQGERLYAAMRDTLKEWTERLRAQNAGRFPDNVTAFREEMAVHGRFGKPCPDCGTRVQRIRYAARETNYCPRCQTGGRVLADRSLSRLLKKDWPRSIEELEMRQR